MNRIVDFYREHQISPVHQDIADFEYHCKRREKLYRQLGIPVISFRNSSVLEVGPGGGYNSLALAQWKCKLNLLEPNEVAQKEIEELFVKYGISDYQLYKSSIEDFEGQEKYDIVLAEGFLPTIENWEQVFELLTKRVEDKGILVITCQDEMGMFVERMKRLVGHIVIKGIKDYEKKVDKLVEVFEPQLKFLGGVSRPARDWVQDQLLCQDFNIEEPLTMKRAIQFLDGKWEYLGSSSPNFFTDYS